MPQTRSQREIVRDLLAARGILRLAELRDAGVTAATVSRMEKDGEVIRLARGLYQLPDAELDVQIRVLRFSDDLLIESVETHVIEGVSVKVFGVAKTVADCFRHRGKISLAVALEGLQEALRQRKSTPAEIARAADTGGVGTVIRPYLEALTTNG